MTQRRVTPGRIVLAAVAVLVAAGVVFAVMTLSGGLPDRVYELASACGGTTYDDAAPYTGPGPHPVAIFMPSEFGELLLVRPDMPDRSDWPAANPEDPAAVHLVAWLRSVLVEGEDTRCPPAISADSPPERLLSELTAAQWQPVLADVVVEATLR